MKKPPALPLISTLAITLLLFPTPVSAATPSPAPAPSPQATPQTQTQDTITIKPHNITGQKSPYLLLHLKIPVLHGLQDRPFQSQLNHIILRRAHESIGYWEQEAAKTAATMKERGYDPKPYHLYIDYKVTADGSPQSDNLFSMTVTTYCQTLGTSKPRIDTYNFLNTSPAQPVTLQDLFGKDYKKIINTHIAQEIAKQPDLYFQDAFKGISDTQDFYVEKGEAVIMFDKYEIAPGYVGNPEFRLPIPPTKASPDSE